MLNVGRPEATIRHISEYQHKSARPLTIGWCSIGSDASCALQPSAAIPSCLEAKILPRGRGMVDMTRTSTSCTAASYSSWAHISNHITIGVQRQTLESCLVKTHICQGCRTYQSDLLASSRIENKLLSETKGRKSAISTPILCPGVLEWNKVECLRPIVRTFRCSQR